MKSIPNILTILRLLACPILIYLFFFGTYLTILAVFILACLTDFFDGYLARKESLKTNLGKFLEFLALNPIVCKIVINLLYSSELSLLFCLK